jgi:hypothetical protein
MKITAGIDQYCARETGGIADRHVRYLVDNQEKGGFFLKPPKYQVKTRRANPVFSQ